MEPWPTSRTASPPRAWLPNVVLAASILLTVLAAYFVACAADAKDSLRFDNAIRYVTDTVEDRMDIYAALLESTRAYFEASDHITDDQFRSFIASMAVETRYPGVRGIGYAPRTAAGALPVHLGEERVRDAKGFKVWPSTSEADAYPIVFLEPADEQNHAALGFDMYSEPVRRAAMQAARDTGVSVVSGPVRLIQEPDPAAPPGFLLYTPIYGGTGVPTTVDERRAKIEGFVYAAFRADDFFRGVFGDERGKTVDFAIHYGAEATPATLLYQSTGARNNGLESARFRATRPVRMALQLWTVRYTTRPEFEAGSSRDLTFLTLFAGLMTSALLFVISRSQVRARVEAERYAGQLLSSREKLRVSEARLRRLVDSNLIGIELFDASGRLLEANDAFLELLGLTRRDLESGSLSWDKLKPADRVALDRAALAEIAAKGESTSYETVYLRRDGTAVPVLEGLASYGASDDVFVGFTLDLTERKRVERERAALLEREREARQLAEEANRTKDEFLATVSHELRTPLNAILGWTRLLTTGKLDGSAEGKALDTIERNARAQAQLIDDLLDVSRIMSGKLRLKVEPVDLVRVVESALEAVRPAATAKMISLETELDRDTGAVSGDSSRLEQVIWNLLANAVKFTPRGGVVRVKLSAADTYAVVSIVDSGPGIDPSFLPYVFERFRQADSSITRAHGGLGLGLAIVRHLTEIHGGTVAASNGEAGGAAFTVRLPLMGVTLDGSKTATVGDGRDVTLDGVRVLVVDDDKDSRDVLAVSLEQYGASVRTCASGEQALDALEHWEADVVVSDVAMPNMDGLELVRRIRASANSHLPAIALTAYARGADRRQTFASGFQAHLKKPFEAEKLVATIAKLARR